MRKLAKTPLEIRLLGTFEISVDGVPVNRKSWHRRKPMQLVKLLALQPNYKLHREQAMELLWRNADPETAANSLNKAIHAARLALEPELSKASNSQFIVTEDQQIVLRSSQGLWVDADEFQRLAKESIKTSASDLCEAALSLYRGELLIEDPYEEWVVKQRERLRDTYLDLLKRFSKLCERRGEYGRSIELLQSLIIIDPTDEAASRDLMRLCARTGDRHHAFVQYARCVETLSRELDVAPERATVELYHQIVGGKIEQHSQHSAREEASHEGTSETSSHDTSLPSRERPHRASGQRILDSIAVLPFGNEGNDKRSELLSDGLSESVIGRLSQLPQLRVIAWSSVSRYRTTPLVLSQVGRDLEARTVLTGRVSWVDDRLVVEVELADAMDGSVLWSEQFDRLPSDVFAVQGEIARAISEKLWLELVGEDRRRLDKRYTDNTEAFELYLKGRFCWNSRMPDRMVQAIDYFGKAVRLDPSYALAYSGLADCHSMLASYGAVGAREGFGKAREFAQRALELDINLAEAHASSGYITALHDWDMERAESQIRRSIDLKPQEATFRQWLGIFLISARGKVEEGLAEMERARQNDPVSLVSVAAVGWGLYFSRLYGRAIEELRKTVDLDPNYYVAHVYLGRTYLQKEMHKEAIACFWRAHTLNPEDTAIAAETAYVYASSGEPERALEILNQLTANAEREYVSPYWLALIHLALGNVEQTFVLLEEAYEERSGYLFWLNVEPRFDCLRGDERFVDLLRRVGF
jgi:DNA-binding SARP family transcriptional activator/Flp pilus assembly protein TadD